MNSRTRERTHERRDERGLMMLNADLDVSGDALTGLANDLDEMQRYLEQQTRVMDGVVDRVAAGWQGPTATAYRSLHRGVAENAVRIRQVMVLLEAAMRASRDGFTEQELDTLARIRRMQDGEDVSAAARDLTVPDPASGPNTSRPQSRILDV
ncbi:WXG100 family type VII secretion target [Streptomyces sp. NBC_01255]|uniref:WXG100 family type VII secretion target n=1 Tax=Streptomyces sp. NBC_01255 TaxID=2903798 RepID=UPI002E2F4303|nr:WXG100 family type VII secretion target [Streptomyces sp. NBC_01255]